MLTWERWHPTADAMVVLNFNEAQGKKG